MTPGQSNSALGLRPEEAARLLGVSAGTLRRWADSGWFPVNRTPGGQRRYPLDGLRAFVRNRGEQQ